MSTTSETRRPRLWPGLMVLGVGVVCGLVGVVMLWSGGLSALYRLPVEQAPTTVTLQCAVGDYYVYQHIETQTAGPGFSSSSSGPTTLTPGEVRVSGPGGGLVATWAGSGGETIMQGSDIYASAVGFHAARVGTYRVRISAVWPRAMLIGPSLGSVFVRSLGAIGLSGIGGLISLVGLVLVIIAAILRSQSRRGRGYSTTYGAVYPPGYPATYPGSYPPGHGPGYPPGYDEGGRPGV